MMGINESTIEWKRGMADEVANQVGEKAQSLTYAGGAWLMSFVEKTVATLDIPFERPARHLNEAMLAPCGHAQKMNRTLRPFGGSCSSRARRGSK